MKKIALMAAALAALSTAAMAEGDIKAGKKVFKKCKACHSLKPEDNKVGPTLYNIIDAASGANPDFRYSKAMSEAGLTWDVETLSAFLTKPKDVVPRTSMAFSGLKKPEQVDDLIAYLQSEMEAE
ncbi:MAG: c-type cytochrome [Cognatishimia activa]